MLAPHGIFANTQTLSETFTLQDIGAPEKERVREEFMQKARATKGF